MSPDRGRCRPPRCSCAGGHRGPYPNRAPGGRPRHRRERNGFVERALRSCGPVTPAPRNLRASRRTAQRRGPRHEGARHRRRRCAARGPSAGPSPGGCVEAAELRRGLRPGAVEHGRPDADEVEPAQQSRDLRGGLLRLLTGHVGAPSEAQGGAAQFGANQRAGDHPLTLAPGQERTQRRSLRLVDDQLRQGARIEVEQRYRQSPSRSAARSSDRRTPGATRTGLATRTSCVPARISPDSTSDRRRHPVPGG